MRLDRPWRFPLRFITIWCMRISNWARDCTAAPLCLLTAPGGWTTTFSRWSTRSFSRCVVLKAWYRLTSGQFFRIRQFLGHAGKMLEFVSFFASFRYISLPKFKLIPTQHLPFRHFAFKPHSGTVVQHRSYRYFISFRYSVIASIQTQQKASLREFQSLLPPVDLKAAMTP
ncbi:hypothetical protein IWX46DRAFT_607992 [Phyllosticta citricarpa]|uniref:Secreted protein n=1 Tax=Phyllosticta citricarpa TaxID=55181 RepID=A0ABR1LV56_9PEZI